MNVHLCVSIILDRIYVDPVKYFKGIDGKTLQPTKREYLKVFLLKTLKNFSIINTPLGVYQQK